MEMILILYVVVQAMQEEEAEVEQLEAAMPLEEAEEEVEVMQDLLRIASHHK